MQRGKWFPEIVPFGRKAIALPENSAELRQPAAKAEKEAAPPRRNTAKYAYVRLKALGADGHA